MCGLQLTSGPPMTTGLPRVWARAMIALASPCCGIMAPAGVRTERGTDEGDLGGLSSHRGSPGLWSWGRAGSYAANAEHTMRTTSAQRLCSLSVGEAERC